MLLLPLRLDLAPHLVHRLILYFNPRTPVGYDMRYHSITPVRCNFNPRTPVGCAPVQKYSTTVSKFQSTHPSGVRPGRHRLLLGRGAISIHAPQWSATIRRECGWHVMPFQSTHPVRGATWYLLVGSAYSSNFNPRAP